MRASCHHAIVAAAILAAGPFLATAAAADWPMARGGPALLGIAADKLPEKPVLLWTAKTGGPIKSSAAIIGNRVFIGSNDTNVYALELDSGK